LLAWVAACGHFGFDPTGSPGDGGRATGDGGSADGGSSSTPSCVALPATCGASASDSCCDSPMIPGGTFYRGDDASTDGMFTDMTHAATVSTFRLDKYEVTVGRFRAFVAAGQGIQSSPPASGAGARSLNGLAVAGGWDSSWNSNLEPNSAALETAIACGGANYGTWTPVAGSNENRPITCVTWYEAMAFCVWDGGFLPTEAEWHYAASGGSEQRAYPWSSPASSLAISCSETNYGGANAPQTLCSAAGPSDVGSWPDGDGDWGQSDLAGNVYEWVLDWYATPYMTPCNDCADLTVTSARVMRGGSFYVDETRERAAERLNYYAGTPTDRDGDLGVRCARAP